MGASAASRGLGWQARNVLLGICLGGAGAALFWQFYPGFWKEDPDAAIAAAVEQAGLLQEQARLQRATASAEPQRATAPEPRTACAIEPQVPPASAGDGHLRAEHPFPAAPRAKAKVFLRKARTAASQGRARDAEVALLAACRYSQEASAAPTVPLARVLGQLGEHYLAAAGSSPGSREALIARAREMLELSAGTYAQALGPNARRSREARERLAVVEDGVRLAADAPTAKGPVQVDASLVPTPPAAQTPPRAASARPPAQRPMATRPRRGTQEGPAAPGLAPIPQAPVLAQEQGDPELRQRAADLARLRAQAQAVSDDPEGFRRRAALAQAQRAQCRDAACLRDWHARRRQELLAEF